MQANPPIKDRTFLVLEDFFYAGSSALFLSVVHLYPAYWFLSLFALLPLFWHLTRANLKRSIVLGIILAGCYTFVAFTGELLVSPGTFLLKFFILSFIFSLFCVAFNRIKRYTGFNPIFIAALWLGLEYILTHQPSLGNILTLPESSSGFLIRLSSLFGILMVSFAVVLINSLILILLRNIAEALSSRTPFPVKNDKRIYLPFKEIILQRRWYYFPDLRAPPMFCFLS